MKTYFCVRCGKRASAEKLVYSPHTGNRYCGPYDLGCERRAKRRRKSQTVRPEPMEVVS